MGALQVLSAQALSFYPVAGSPFSSGTLSGYFNVGDFNGDGNPDILVGDGTLMLGDGHGRFTRSPGPAFPERSSAVVGDFNGDGRSDIAILTPIALNPSTNILNVYLGNRDGTFTLGPANPVFSSGGLAAVGDFNGDGKLDLFTGLSVLFGDGRGGFAASPGALPLSVFGSVQVADFNGDGRLDLAVAVTANGSETNAS